MKTTLSASRWICLFTLTVVMIFSAQQADTIILGLSCCNRGQFKGTDDVQRCYEQKPRSNCNHHAFVIITSSNKKICIKPNSPWLKQRLVTGEINCPPEFLNKGRFEVLDEDDVE